MQELFFAYGTILEGASDPQVQAALDRYTERVDAGRVAGRLYDLGPYPGAVPQVPEDPRATWVHGEILTLLDPRRVFQVLDPYEDCDPARPRAGLYRRGRVQAFPAGDPQQPLSCQIYWINRVPPSAHRIPDGDWRSHLRRRSAHA